jgi:tetratricopeptide (TPR) repeat protein
MAKKTKNRQAGGRRVGNVPLYGNAARGNVEMFFNTAVRFHRAGDLRQAEANYRQALSLDPDHGGSLCNLAVLAESVGRPDVGVELLSRAVALHPQEAAYFFNLGNMLDGCGRAAEAEECYLRTLQLVPGHVDARNNLGLLLKDRGQIREALAQLEEVVRQQPGRGATYINLGALCRELGNEEAAFNHYKKAEALGETPLELFVNKANLLLQMHEIDEAQITYEQALAKDPGCLPAQGGLGAILERRGNYDEAERILQPIIATGVTDPIVVNAYAGLCHQQGRDQEAIALLEKALGDPAVVSRSDSRRSLHFMLGKLLDAVKEYDQAFYHYRQGNELKQMAFDEAALKQRFRGYIDFFRPERYGHLPRATSQDETPIFIVGMPRSGTSLTEQILASHPDVYGAGELKLVRNLVNRPGADYPNFLTTCQPDELDRLAAGHVAALRKLGDDKKHVSDKMPYNYIFLGFLHHLFPKAKIIHCRRDPVDICLSIYFQDFVGRHEYAYDLRNLAVYYREYDRLMRHWRDSLGIPMLEVCYEDMIADQEGMSRRLLAHCGLEWHEDCATFYERKRIVKTASYQQVRQPIYTRSVARWKKYEKHLGPLLAGLEDLQASYQEELLVCAA